MKGLGLVVLLAMLIIMIVFTLKDGGKKGEEGKTYQQEMIDVISKAEELELNTKIKNLKDALDSYSMDHGEYPEVLEDVMPEYTATYDSLTDPWGTRFAFEKDDQNNYVLVSAGKDRTFNTQDDIRRSI